MNEIELVFTNEAHQIIRNEDPFSTIDEIQLMNMHDKVISVN